MSSQEILQEITNFFHDICFIGPLGAFGWIIFWFVVILTILVIVKLRGIDATKTADDEPQTPVIKMLKK